MNNIIQIAHLFEIGEVLNVLEYGSGIINETYLAENTSKQKFILQKHHHLIGKEVLADIDVITKRLENKGVVTEKLIRTLEGGLYVAKNGNIWRMLTYIEGVTLEKLDNKELAKSAGALIGKFHDALVGLDYQFEHKIPNYHDTNLIITILKDTCAKYHNSKKYNELRPSADSILNEYINIKDSLINLPERIIHGDLKLSNVRFDEKQNEAISLLDLDTLGTNKIVIDLGDAIRSFCNIQDKFDLKIFESIVEGYFSTALFLTKEEKDAIPIGIKTIILELSARYITDAFEESYFKLDNNKYSALYEQNKSKAESLIKLYKDFQNKVQAVEDIISTTTSLQMV
ncbi:MAG: phosphotransferase [Candidatus Dadabacteria bacterium]|nr:phosphotransferase [Candidatus Dadabacteria bacterium]